MKAFVNARLVFPDEIRPGNLLVESGKILACGQVIPPENAEIIDCGGAYLGPGLFDTHVHGYAGSGLDSGFYYAATDPAGMAMAHLRSGTTAITPSTAYSWTMEEFLSCIALSKKAMAEGGTSIVGIHFEGPFTNPKYGANAKAAWTFSRELCDKIFDAAGAAVLHCTYAPELPCAPELENYLQERGVVMDIGHTELSPADAARAVSKGARIVTHLYDAMGCWRGNDSVAVTGVIQETAADVVLGQQGLFYELICDSRGVHVKPANMRVALRAAGEDRIILVTDCTSHASHDPGRYPDEDPRSAPDLNYNEAMELSGSRLILSDVCRNFMHHTGADVRVAFKCASTNPAKALGMENSIGLIAPGREANLLLVDEKFRVLSVYFRGQKVE